MADVITPIDGLFASPEFETQLTEWQRARMRNDEAEGRFADHLAARYEGDPAMSQYDIDEQVSWFLEMDPEEFERESYYDDRAQDLSQQRTAAQTQEDEAKETLLAVSRGIGVSEFALYGLWLHTRESGLVAAPRLKAQMQDAERDLGAIDKMVRENAGNILTVVDLGATAGRLGVGGIELKDNSKVIIPQDGDDLNYQTLFYKDMPEVYPSDRPFTVLAHAIRSIFGSNRASRILTEWSDVLDVTNLRAFGHEGALFVLGEPVEGPPADETESDSEREFRAYVVNRMRLVGNAAAHGLFELDTN